MTMPLSSVHWDHELTSPSREGSRAAWPAPLPGGVRGGFVADGSWKAFIRIFPCIGTLNLPVKSKAPQGRRTPKPGGSSGDLGQRASVVECGGPPPLSKGARTRNTYGSWRAPFRFSRMNWDHEPPGKFQSAAGAAHSKTGRKFERPWPARQRLGVRRSYAAFDGSAHSGSLRFMESPLSRLRERWRPRRRKATRRQGCRRSQVHGKYIHGATALAR